jgi:hypothetical protein
VSDHFAAKAAFIAALAADDPERVEAETHARSCDACARALGEGRGLVAMLDRVPAPPPLSGEALARVSALIERERDRERTASMPRLLAPAAVVVAWALELAIAKKLAHGATGVVISVGWALAAASLAAWAGVRARAAAIGATVASLLLVLAAMGDDAGVHALLGVKCTLLELVAACIPFGVAVAFARRAGHSVDPWRASAMAAAGALAGHAALHLSCKVPHAGPHLFVFHFGGVVLAALLARGGAHALRPRSA